MGQTPANCETSAEAPSPALREHELGPTPAPRANCQEGGRDYESVWQSEVDHTLGFILQRVGRVEDVLASVAGDIANIMGELKAICRIVRDDAAVRGPSNNVRMQPPHTNVATSNPYDWQQCVSHSNAGDMVEDATTPLQQVDPPGTEANRPILVDLENTSKESGDNNGTFGVRTQTPESHSKRVHSQPRGRVVPCAKKLLGVAANAGIGECSAGAIVSPTPYSNRYKDPPGYENVTDFGAPEEPYFKPPLLQPKNHGVRPHLIMDIY